MGVEIRVPSLGESVAEATVARWFKQIGDTVTEDEPIVELETDKVTLEFNAPASGTLAEILVEEGGDVEVGALLGSIDQGAVAKTNEARAGKAGADEAGKEAPPDRGDGPLSPAVRKLIDEHGLDTAAITPTGPKGNITKGDVLAAIEAGAPAARPEAVPAQAEAEAEEPEPVAEARPEPVAKAKPEPVAEAKPEPKEPVPAAAARPAPSEAKTETRPAARRETPPAPVSPAPRPAAGAREERVKMTRLRRRIAERLKEAQNTAAILTTYNEADMSAVLDLRARYRDSFQQKHGVRLGFMSFFVKAAINALQVFPAVNAEIDGDEIVTTTATTSASR